MNKESSVTILRCQQVLNRVGLSRSQIYALIDRKQFPQQIKLGARASGWLSSEIDGWLADRIAASRTSN
jgi:prophage regulatory protein